MIGRNISIEDVLAELHIKTAEQLFEIIANGVPHPEDPSIKVPAPANYYMAALRLLKDNNITALPRKGSPLYDLTQLPAFDTDVDPEEVPEKPR